MNLKTNFESFYQSLAKTITPFPDDKKELLKTKLRNTYEQYSRIKVPFKHKKVIDNLRKREDIVIMKQDKGRGVVIIDKDRYTEKCLEFLNSPQFKLNDNDNTQLIEGQVQRLLRKIKKHLPEDLYDKLYPTGSNPGRFYGTAKVHKMADGDRVDKLPIRPIISNIGTPNIPYF